MFESIFTFRFKSKKLKIKKCLMVWAEWKNTAHFWLIRYRDYIPQEMDKSSIFMYDNASTYNWVIREFPTNYRIKTWFKSNWTLVAGVICTKFIDTNKNNNNNFYFHKVLEFLFTDFLSSLHNVHVLSSIYLQTYITTVVT